MYNDFYLQTIIPALVKNALNGEQYLILRGQNKFGDKINIVPDEYDFNSLIEEIKSHGYKIIHDQPINTYYISLYTENTVF